MENHPSNDLYRSHWFLLHFQSVIKFEKKCTASLGRDNTTYICSISEFFLFLTLCYKHKSKLGIQSQLVSTGMHSKSDFVWPCTNSWNYSTRRIFANTFKHHQSITKKNMQLSGHVRCQDQQKERGGCALLSPPVQNKSRQDKEKYTVWHRIRTLPVILKVLSLPQYSSRKEH